MSCDYFKTSLCNCKAYECVVKYDIVILQNHTMFNPFTTTHQGQICFADSLSGFMPLLIVGALGAPSDEA